MAKKTNAKCVEIKSDFRQLNKKRQKNVNGCTKNLTNIYASLDNPDVLLKCQEDFRLKAGEEPKEIFQDCECEENEELQLIDTINEIKNPKEFKILLKQMAYISNIGYRTFRQMYKKAKKNKHKIKQNYCLTCKEICETVGDHINENNMNEVEGNSQKIPITKYTQFNDSLTNVKDPLVNNLGNEKICPKCLGLLEGETLIYCEKYSQKCLGTESKNIEPENQHLDLNGEHLSETLKDENDRKSAGKQILNLTPLSITIPLKLQIDGHNNQTHVIETEIVMEAFGADQGKIASTLQKKPSSDLFQSCISGSGIIKPDETQNTSDINTLNKILEFIQKYTSDSAKAEIEERQSCSEIKTMTEPKAIQVSLSETVATATSSAPKLSSSKTVFIKTEEILPKESSASLPPLPDPKLKAKRLKVDLINDIKVALKQTSIVEALKSFKEAKRLSLPTNLRPKEMSGIATARYSAPTTYQAIPTSAASLKPLVTPLVTTVAGDKVEGAKLPDLPSARPPSLERPPVVESPAKPDKLPPSERPHKPDKPPKPDRISPPAKFITETVQTDAAALKFSAHFMRTDMRNKILEDLTQLLKENSSKTQARYEAEQRDEVLLDLQRLFHPTKSALLTEQKNRENALQDIRFLLEPEDYKSSTSDTTKASLTASESQDSILQYMKYILNPKSQQKPKKKIFAKNQKDKILEDLNVLLTPRQEKTSNNREVRDSVLQDLRYLLTTDQQSAANQQLSEEPSSSRAQQNASSDIRDSLMADLRYLLDSTQYPSQASISAAAVTQTNRNITSTASTIAAQNNSGTTITSEASAKD